MRQSYTLCIEGCLICAKNRAVEKIPVVFNRVDGGYCPGRRDRRLHNRLPSLRYLYCCRSRSNAAPLKGITMTLLPCPSLPFSSSFGTSMTASVTATTWPFSRNTLGRSILFQWLTVPSV